MQPLASDWGGFGTGRLSLGRFEQVRACPEAMVTAGGWGIVGSICTNGDSMEN